MSVRINTVLEVCSTSNDTGLKLFGGGGSQLSEILDTLAHSTAATYELGAGESDLDIDLGDISEVRWLYIEADGDFELSFGVVAATSAVIDAVGGSYPTGFVGGEALALDVDGVAIALTFEATDQTVDQVVARINYEAALAGFLSQPVAFKVGGQVRLQSPVVGLSSTAEVVSGDAAVLTALGLSVGTAQGDTATPGTSNLVIPQPADASGVGGAEGVKAYILTTAQATSIKLTNPGSGPLKLQVYLAGDLVSTP